MKMYYFNHFFILDEKNTENLIFFA